MNDWNPQQYLIFKSERTQPSIDLVSRISIENPKTIIDIGCGPGNSTQILSKRWPAADITGIDSSQKMIEKARADYPRQKWELQDASKFNLNQKYDIVFSNATLQWIQDHDLLIPRLFSMVNDNGVLAVQIPANNESPFYKILLKTAQNSKWAAYTADCEKMLTFHNAGYYYNTLCTLTHKLDIWTTTYYHIMTSHKDLTDWHKSTGMRPFLEQLLTERDREEFENEVVRECMMSYPVQRDGKILYPFQRIFFTAVRCKESR
ncbi:MAG TPA: methyltransferase domain-containing protein [Nitrospirota bacterium]|nr:methyltransferase domain-containing protein [Nitrospirota bacterium]